MVDDYPSYLEGSLVVGIVKIRRYSPFLILDCAEGGVEGNLNDLVL